MIFNASDSTGLLLDLFNYILLFAGLYCFYAWYQLRDGTIPERFSLLSKDLSVEKCLDQGYYVSYLRPRLLIFAILTTILGTVTVLEAKFGVLTAILPEYADTVALILGSFLPFALVVWFGYCICKIQRELWV